MAGSLASDRFVDFVLFELLDAPALCKLPAYSEHSKETFELILRNARKLAREVLAPAYKPMDADPPKFVNGAVLVHPIMRKLFPHLIEVDFAKATRPESKGGMGLPHTVATMATVITAAANLGAIGYLALTSGAAHLIEAFGDEKLNHIYRSKMISGEWTGTMALTEPHAGSSLSDVMTTATPANDGSYRMRGSKIFISGGDQDLTENIVHLLLARIEGAAPGTKGISLFVVPKKRPKKDGDDTLVPNDVHTTGLLHKMGWKGLPSVALSFGDENDCHAWLVGEPHQGLRYMFQMMNEARILVGLQAAATASAAYQEALDYARNRPQGRSLTSRDPRSPQIPIIDHPDVRRMLLRQKSIIEGALALLARTALYSDLAASSESKEERAKASLLLDLLTPIAKTFPAERGFESNALAVQIHGGYGYTSEYLVESYLRDQKLNTIHEGTSGIQSLDLLGRKVIASQGDALRALAHEIEGAIAEARKAGVDASWCDALSSATTRVVDVTMHLASLGIRGEVENMMLHSADYLEMISVVVIAWQWVAIAARVKTSIAASEGDARAFYEGEIFAAQYWIKTELPRVSFMADLCVSGERSYVDIPDASF